MQKILSAQEFFKNESIFNLSTNKKFDLIISNPPYISLKEIPNLEYQVSLYDPLNALTDYSDGLNFYRFFNDFANSHLKKMDSCYLNLE